MNFFRTACLFLLALQLFASGNRRISTIWINGDTFHEFHYKGSEATLIFSRESPFSDEFKNKDEFRVAIRLDKALNPVMNARLPSLKTLSAIQSEELILEYLSFLESFGRSNAIDFLILPDSAGYTKNERQVLLLAKNTSPYYFIDPAAIKTSLPTTKKEFIQSIQRDHIWLAEQNSYLSKYQKWEARYADENELVKGIKYSLTKPFRFTDSFHDELRDKIIYSSITLVDKHEKLPFLTDHHLYHGADEELKDIFSLYSVMSDKGAPIGSSIVDRRTGDFHIEPGNLVIDYLENIEDIDDENPTLLVPKGLTIDPSLLTKMVLGRHAIKGSLGISNERFLEAGTFLNYSDVLNQNKNLESGIRRIAEEAINLRATPGMQIAVVQNGDIIHEKAYGYYTYDSLFPVQNQTLYDLASLTKTMATLPAVARLLDQNLIELDDPIARHMPEFKGSNKDSITIRQLLAHQAGLKAYVPFWNRMLEGDRLDVFYYRTPEDSLNDVRTYGLEPHPLMIDSVKKWIVASDLSKKQNTYHYSDLGFMILHMLIEEISGMSFDEYLVENFYAPMGLRSLVFNPLENGYTHDKVAPTEFDQRYRRKLLWGEVHDRNAAVFSGVSGHAGLFGNARDIAKMTYMFMQEGKYGYDQYLSASTVDLFNKRHFPDNHRGLGWNKRSTGNNSASVMASDSSFGHTGFTGSMVWADPQNDLIFVLLTNRVYPNADNWKFNTLDIRTRIHDLVYSSLN